MHSLLLNSEVPPLYRFLTSAVLALGITTGLFLIMEQLIRSDLQLEEDPPQIVGQVVMDRPEDPEILDQQEVEPIPDPEVQPKFEPENFTTDYTPDDTLAFRTPDPKLDRGEIGISSYSGIVPIVKVEAIYPSRAITKGIEGYVDLMFDVTVTGKTVNIRVVASQPKGYFEKAAIRALEKWKYKPPIKDGVAHAQPDMMTRMTFALEN